MDDEVYIFILLFSISLILVFWLKKSADMDSVKAQMHRDEENN